MAKKKTQNKLKILLFGIIILIGGLYFGFRQLRQAQIFELSVSTPSHPFGAAINFENEYFNDTYVATDSSSLVSNQFTVETWVNIPAPTFGNYLKSYPIITYTKPQTWVDYGYNFQLSAEVQDSNGQYRPSFSALMANSSNNMNSNYVSVISPTSLEPNSWHHIAVTSYTINQVCQLDLYIDGILVANGNKYRLNCTISSQQPQKLTLAKPTAGAGGISGYYYTGMLDELRISNARRYVNNFTPKNIAFTKDVYTSILYHFDGNLFNAASGKFGGQLYGIHSSYFSAVFTSPSPSIRPSPLPSPSQICYWIGKIKICR